MLYQTACFIAETTQRTYMKFYILGSVDFDIGSHIPNITRSTQN